MTAVHLLEQAPGRQVSIPGAPAPARARRLLRSSDAGWIVLLVTFPPRWERAAVGSYDENEEFVLLDGTLELSGHRFAAGDYGFIPAGAPRIATCSPAGAVALVYFPSLPAWRPGSSSVPADAIVARPLTETPPAATVTLRSDRHGRTEWSWQLPATGVGTVEHIDVGRALWRAGNDVLEAPAGSHLARYHFEPSDAVNVRLPPTP